MRMKTRSDMPGNIKSPRTHLLKQLPCFSETAWNEWIEMAKVTRTQKNPCYDCSIKHRDSMTQRGLCEHPETIFVEMKTGGDVNPSCGISSLDERYFRALLLGKPSEKIVRIKNQPSFSFLAPYFQRYMAEESGFSS